MNREDEILKSLESIGASLEKLADRWPEADNGKSDSGSADLDALLEEHTLVIFTRSNCPGSTLLVNMLSNLGATDLVQISLDSTDTYTRGLAHALAHSTGHEKQPYLLLNGHCVGTEDEITNMVRTGELQQKMKALDLHVLDIDQTPSLEKNVYGYPKGGLGSFTKDEGPGARPNILLGACGSSAADKVPELAGKLVDLGYKVKVVPSPSAEHFFKDWGMKGLLDKVSPSDIYRDGDEWGFRYTEFGMAVRACHLALTDWADIALVAPVTCNTMGKISHGCADSILTSVFVAWQYQAKPAIFAPACNTHMWNNISTQNSVELLETMGVTIVGPRKGRLTNGAMGIGMMATPDELIAAVEEATEKLKHEDMWVLGMAQQAAASGDRERWRIVFRHIDEGTVDVNVQSAKHHNDTLLFFAAGGAGDALEEGADIQPSVPDARAARELIDRGIDVTIENDFHHTALDVAAVNGNIEVCRLLIDAGAKASTCRHLDASHIDLEISALLQSRASRDTEH